jgi:signal peptidase I
MTAKTAQPRSIISILFIGIMLGPVFLMLWMGRWKAALVFLGAVIAMTLAAWGAEVQQLIPAAPVLAGYTMADVAALVLQNVAGIAYAFRIRQAALTRPWYRWIAAVPAALVAIMLIVALPVRTFLFQPFTIPSSSEFPNLVEGDYVLASKSAYGYSRYSFPFEPFSFEGRILGHPPQRGDVAVFRLPTNPAIDYVKRVVGLPGDRVQMKGGVLHINGEAAKLEEIGVAAEYQMSGTSFYRETLPGGHSHVIAKLDNEGWPNNTEEYLVPMGHYFVMGDNRDNSQDSRFLDLVGYVPEENFIGPVSMIVTNTEGVPTGNRPE